MPMSRCFFCRRKIGKRKRGKLAYEDIYARDPSLGYLVCIDCFEALEESIRKVRLRQIDESKKRIEARDKKVAKKLLKKLCAKGE
ncbi:hypothetical protein ES703_69663 [subsurface metagenome]